MINYRGWGIDFDIREVEGKKPVAVVFITQEIGHASTVCGALEMGKEEIDKIFPEE